MSDISCFSAKSFFSDDSEFNYIPENVAIESEIATQSGDMKDGEDNIERPNSSEPLAYRKKWQRDRMLTSRFKGLESTESGTLRVFLPTLVTTCLSRTPSSSQAGFSTLT